MVVHMNLKLTIIGLVFALKTNVEILAQHLSNNLNFSKDSVFAEGLSPGSSRVIRIVSRGPTPMVVAYAAKLVSVKLRLISYNHYGPKFCLWTDGSHTGTVAYAYPEGYALFFLRD